MAEAKQTIVVPATIESKFNITLTENGFQKMADRASKLVFNEEPENLEAIKNFLADVRKIEIAIEATHKKGKEPSLLEGKQWDLAKNTFLTTAANVKTSVQTRYTKLCQDVAQKQADQEKERLRVQAIKDGIEGNAVHYASKIAAANSTKELTAIESLINLEKTRKEKYGEYLQTAIDRYSQLNALLKEQKTKVAKLEQLQQQEKEALAAGDEQALIDLAGKKEEAEQAIDESKIMVQEKAAEQTIGSEIQVANVVYSAPRPKRSVWKWKVTDLKVTAKKMPSFVKMVPDEEAIDAYLAAKKAENIKDDFDFAGIHFYLDKTY